MRTFSFRDHVGNPMHMGQFFEKSDLGSWDYSEKMYLEKPRRSPQRMPRNLDAGARIGLSTSSLKFEGFFIPNWGWRSPRNRVGGWRENNFYFVLCFFPISNLQSGGQRNKWEHAQIGLGGNPHPKITRQPPTPSFLIAEFKISPYSKYKKRAKYKNAKYEIPRLVIFKFRRRQI